MAYWPVLARASRGVEQLTPGNPGRNPALIGRFSALFVCLRIPFYPRACDSGLPYTAKRTGRMP